MSAKKTANPGFSDLVNVLKRGNIPPVFLLFGEEQYLVQWAVRNLKKRYVVAGMEAMDFVHLEGDKCTPEDVVSAAQTYSMLSDRRVVWVSKAGSLKGDADVLAGYVADPNEGCVLILTDETVDGRSSVVKAVKNHGGLYEFGRVSERELRSFARKQFAAEGVEVKPALIERMIRQSGYGNRESTYRLYNLQNDIRKIVAHAAGGQVTEADVDLMVAGDQDTFIFDLIDGISGNDKSRALEILHNRLSGNAYDGVRIMFTVISQLELMLQIREFQDSPEGPTSAGQIARRMKMNEYRVNKAAGYAARYPLRKLREILLAAYDCYTKSITGVLPARLAMELLIARI